MKNNLDHPCAGVCSGWKQAHEKGLAEAKEKLDIAIAAMKEALTKSHCHYVLEKALNELNETPEPDEWRDILRQDAENP